MNGSYLATHVMSFSIDQQGHPIHDFDLCAGAVINTLYYREVKATAGYATFPARRFMRGSHHHYAKEPAILSS